MKISVFARKYKKAEHHPAFAGGVHLLLLQETTTLQFQKLLAQKLLSATDSLVENMPELPYEDIHHPE